MTAKTGLWLRGFLAVGLYAVAVGTLALALPAVGAEHTPTSDPDTAAGAFLCLTLSTLSLALTAGVSRRWRTARLLCLLHLVLVVIVWTRVPSPFASYGGEPERRFPGAFPGSITDVSADRAFRDHGLRVPATAEVVGYWAWSADDTYPMAAVLRMPCSALPDFVSGSGLRPASSAEGGVTGVRVFAEDHGWAGDESDPLYLRDRDHAGVITHRTGPERTVYLHT
ncbi:hypothetical protein AB0941_21025 [Streptomyces sp. NPDC013433]|uniref:hypothetical protein n=1 Tax=Streptomyces sp. NPDC013433 TaxID=3155604 RepID=UPI003452A9F8